MPTISASPTAWVAVLSKARAMGQQHSTGAYTGLTETFQRHK